MERILEKLNYTDSLGTIGVIGDSILDKYIYGILDNKESISFTPKKKYYYLGGAGNVAHNVLSNGCSPVYLSVYGKSDKTKAYTSLLEGKGLSNAIIIKDKVHDISLKTRYVVENKILLEMNEDCNADISEETAIKLYNQLNYSIKVNKIRILILYIYDKGCIAEDLFHKIMSLCKIYNVKLLLDCKHKYDFTDIYFLKLNISGFERLTGKKFNCKEDVIKIGIKFKKKNKVQNLLVTMEESGLILFNESNESLYLESKCDRIIDTCGAEDSMMATIAVCLAKGIDLENAVRVANYSAAVSCLKLGTYAVTLDDIKLQWKNSKT
ncbi:MAG: Bifunctional sugar kinase/adenylyltransferase [Anaerocolumna sp.]|nr:Bifunctional sugar kinase/adenylyltransferase [Anaerocolumna sp.]